MKKRAAIIWDISPEAVEWKDGKAFPAGANAGSFEREGRVTTERDKSFDHVAAAYDAVRPGYPDALYDSLLGENQPR